MNRVMIAKNGMMKPDARPGVTIQPQWSCLDIAGSLNRKKKIKMNKELIFAVVAGIGFWGCLLHPAMVVVFGIGVWGMNRYGTEHGTKYER